MQIVPQYIDVEDKIVGPLTWKHLGWIFGGASLIIVAFLMFDTLTFFVVAIPILLITVALAFYKPNGIPFIEFVGFGFTYIFRPKTYTWQREVTEKVIKKDKNGAKIETTSTKKQLTVDEIAAMAQTLDSGGVERNQKMQELIKKNINNKT
jgi:hypothetical protein